MWIHIEHIKKIIHLFFLVKILIVHFSFASKPEGFFMLGNESAYSRLNIQQYSPTMYSSNKSSIGTETCLFPLSKEQFFILPFLNLILNIKYVLLLSL